MYACLGLKVSKNFNSLTFKTSYFDKSILNVENFAKIYLPEQQFYLPWASWSMGYVQP